MAKLLTAETAIWSLFTDALDTDHHALVVKHCDKHRSMFGLVQVGLQHALMLQHNAMGTAAKVGKSLLVELCKGFLLEPLGENYAGNGAVWSRTGSDYCNDRCPLMRAILLCEVLCPSSVITLARWLDFKTLTA